MYIKIETTAKDKNNAREISKKIVDSQYSPCVQINKIHSLYLWNGIKESKEYKIVIKTTENHFKEIIGIIKSISDYDVPEIIKSKFSIDEKDYENWFLKNIKK
tara:strand:+ start:326 stop:634 length:309 start_codon:yes stop_codon:yes gene_type:complete